MTGPPARRGFAPGGKGLSFWSDIAIAGRPKVLSVDASGNENGWEADSAARVTHSLLRRHIPVAGGAAAVVDGPDGLQAALRERGDFNAILLFARADAGDGIATLWEALAGALAGEKKLLAICTWDTFDAAVASRALEAPETFAPMAVVQQSPLSARGAGLFFMKFFAEVDLHSESTGSMTGKMIWFGHSKAREILRRRKYEGRVGLRC